MKNLLLIFLFLISISAFSQESKIIELLNKQLNKEITDNQKQDLIKIVRPFYIDDHHNLVLEVKKPNPYMEQTDFIRSEVALKDISGFIKDINVIFETAEPKVKITTKSYDSNNKLLKTNVEYTHLFFTELCESKSNKKFRDKLLKAFEKAGFPISSEFWFD